MAAPRDRERATLMDRVGLALLSGVSTLMLLGFLWLGGWVVASQLLLDWPITFGWVVAIAALMSVLGFVLLENFVGTWVSGLLRWVLNLLRILGP